MRLELHPEARAELRRAALWYEEQRPGLGDRFISKVAIALERVIDAPEAFPVWPGTRVEDTIIRKATVPRFPYVIAFEKHERHCLVLSIAHAKRRPLYWLARLKP